MQREPHVLHNLCACSSVLGAHRLQTSGVARSHLAEAYTPAARAQGRVTAVAVSIWEACHEWPRRHARLGWIATSGVLAFARFLRTSRAQEECVPQPITCQYCGRTSSIAAQMEMQSLMQQNPGVMWSLSVHKRASVNDTTFRLVVQLLTCGTVGILTCWYRAKAHVQRETATSSTVRRQPSLSACASKWAPPIG